MTLNLDKVEQACKEIREKLTRHEIRILVERLLTNGKQDDREEEGVCEASGKTTAGVQQAHPKEEKDR